MLAPRRARRTTEGARSPPMCGLPDELGSELLLGLDAASHCQVQLASKQLCVWSRGALGLVTGAGVRQVDTDEGANEPQSPLVWLGLGPPRSATALGWIAQHCPRLLAVRLDLTHVADDDAWADLARALPNLRSVWLRGANDARVGALAQHCPALQALDVAGCSAVSDASVARLARGCPQLSELSVSQCPLVTDASLAPLVEAAAPSGGLRRLAAAQCGGVGYHRRMPL